MSTLIIDRPPIIRMAGVPLTPAGAAVAPPLSPDSYADRVDVAVTRTVHHWGAIPTGRRYLLVKQRDEAPEAAGVVDDVLGTVHDARLRVPGRRLPRTQRVAAARTATRPGLGGPVFLSLAGSVVFLLGSWESIRDCYEAIQRLTALREERAEIGDILAPPAGCTPPRSEITVQEQAAVAETLLAINAQERRDEIVRFIFPGVVGFVGTTATAGEVLLATDALGALFPVLAPTSATLAYISGPVVSLFTGAVAVQHAQEFRRTFRVEADCKHLLDAPRVGNEGQVEQWLQDRVRAKRLWSGIGASVYFAATVAGPLAMAVPIVSLTVLVPSVLAIVVSDYVRIHRIGFDPQLTVAQALTLESHYNIANAVEKAHAMHASLHALQEERGRLYSHWSAPELGQVPRLVRWWRQLGNHPEPRSPRTAVYALIRSFDDAETVFVQNQRLLCAQDLSDPTLEGLRQCELQTRISAYDARLAELARDRDALAQALDTSAEAPATEAFRLEHFLVHNGLFKAFTRRLMNDAFLREALIGTGIWTDADALHYLDANEVVLALTDDSPLAPRLRSHVAERMFELAELTMLSTARKSTRFLERELLDLLAERLGLEAAANATPEGRRLAAAQSIDADDPSLC